MDEATTVVQEIANQLGIAVDQTGQFITTYLPQYAALQSMRSAVIIGIVFLGFIISFVAFIVFYKLSTKSYQDSDISDYFEAAFMVAGLIALSLFVVIIICLIIIGPDIIG